VARLKGAVEVPNAVQVEPVGEFELKGYQAHYVAAFPLSQEQ
jgi:hypothetical protein